MRRRTFLTLLAALAAALPLAAVAQQPKSPVVGFLSYGSPDHQRVIGYLAMWRKGLAEAGFVEGRNLAVEFRWVDHNSQLPAGAIELVDHRVDLIMATSGVAARAAKAATMSIPIVF